MFGLEKLAAGKLSHTLIPARILHKFLHKTLREVWHQHSQFVPLYADLHHYYESKMNSYSNDEKYIFVQIPVFFVSRAQKPLNLFWIHTVPVPLDIDTYQQTEAKYTTLTLPYEYLATNDDEYMDITDAALASCHTYHMDFLCENLHLTTDVKELTCAIAIYMDSVETSFLEPNHVQQIIKDRCNFTYHEVLYPLQTEDEILIANFADTNWKLVCDEIMDRPTALKEALYTIINLADLCTCRILTSHGRFLYESMRSCSKPDNRITLYYTYNRALINCDTSITAQASKRYGQEPYQFQAPDLQYYKHEPYLTTNGTLGLRTKRHTPDSPDFFRALAAQQFPLREAVQKMETNEIIYIGPILPSTDSISIPEEGFVEENKNITTDKSGKTNIINKMDTPLSNFIFNVITLLNALLHCVLLIMMRFSFCRGGWFHNVVGDIVQAVLLQKSANAVRLLDPLIHTPTEPQPILDIPIPDNTQTEKPNTDLSFLDIFGQVAEMSSVMEIFLIIMSLLLTPLLLWCIFKYILTPLFHKSNIFRQLCLSCFHNSSLKTFPVTDIFLDIIHIYTGQQIRIYLTTITAPACALAFTGSVKLKNFWLLTRKFQQFVDIDWYNCLLLYNDFIIPLPNRGTAFPFQPNLLTDFAKKGPYNIVLLARHMDTLIQIPHTDNYDFLPSIEKLEFPIPSPYTKVHDEVKALMPLASSVAITPNTLDSDTMEPAAPAQIYAHV